MSEPGPDFSHFGLDATILRAIAEQGYSTPTPIQLQAIPVALQGRDLMGAAQTGTGKTAGFALPILQRLLRTASTSMSPARHPVRALILTPTRELADQVAENVRLYGRHTPLRSTVVFGGVDMHPQTEALRSGVEILIATPGRLLDHVQQKTTSLSQVQILVLDEADRMLDMGFLPDLQRIVNLLPKARQSMMFSATFSDEIRKLARTFLNDPVTIEVARRNAAAETVAQTVYAVAEADKRAALVQILRERDLKQVLIFVNTKIGASRLARQLERDGIVAAAIHGDRSQAERLKALDDFKAGNILALVATDVAARGLDIAELPTVINFDLPYNAEDYVHRIGRTGRAGASGDAISLMSPAEERQVADIEKLMKKTLPRTPLAVHGTASRGGDHDAPFRARGHAVAPPRMPRRPAPAVDDWFSKPYEPASAEASANPPTSGASRAAAARKPAVGALLGGSRKKS